MINRRMPTIYLYVTYTSICVFRSFLSNDACLYIERRCLDVYHMKPGARDL